MSVGTTHLRRPVAVAVVVAVLGLAAAPVVANASTTGTTTTRTTETLQSNGDTYIITEQITQSASGPVITPTHIGWRFNAGTSNRILRYVVVSAGGAISAIVCARVSGVPVLAGICAALSTEITSDISKDVARRILNGDPSVGHCVEIGTYWFAADYAKTTSC